MQKVLVIVGPTASGKSSLAVELAKEYGGEIISGDAIQVYKGLNIGSAKVSKEEQGGVPHFLLDILEAHESYSVAHFQQKARAAIADISERGKLPLICGGTGLYIRACLYDYAFAREEEEDLPYEELSNEDLWNILTAVDPSALQKIHPHNRKRLLRAYNVYQKTGKPFSAHIAAQQHLPLYDAKIIGLNPDRKELYERINRRVETMVHSGLKEEISSLLDKGITFAHLSMQGIGYREYEGFFAGTKSEDEVIQEIQKNTRTYAKRQLTFFRNQLPVSWYNPAHKEQLKAEVEEWIRN